MNQEQEFQIIVADESHESFAEIICEEMAASALARGTGIAKRSPDYIREKMREGKAAWQTGVELRSTPGTQCTRSSNAKNSGTKFGPG